MRLQGPVVIAVTLLLLAGALPALAQEGPPATHIVQPGENLFRIALRYGVSVEALMRANGLSNPDVVVIGQALVIPGAGGAVAPAVRVPSASRVTHRVAPGETLAQIAGRYGVTVEALRAANPLVSPTWLVAGQVLVIPDRAGGADLGILGVQVQYAPTPTPTPVPDLGILAPGAARPAPAVQPLPATATPLPSATPLPPTATATPLPTDAPSPTPAPTLPLPTPTLPATPAENVAGLPAATEPGLLPPDGAAPAEAESAAPETAVAGPGAVVLAGQAVPSDEAMPTGDPSVQSPDLGIIAPASASWVVRPDLITAGGPGVRAIYLRGQALGNNPRAFSKVGDCNSELPFFLGKFDEGQYDLGPYSYLQPAIEHFAGSFGRKSVTAWTGSHVWALFDPTWSNPAYCQPGEAPIACEFRLNRPSIMLIRMGTNESGSPQLFEDHLRRLLDFAIERGVIPILGTKADRLEGSDAINEIIRALAAEYGVPLWDFGRVADTIPGRGLSADGFHMTWYPLSFGEERALQAGHAVHNLTALMALNTVWRSAMY